MGSAANRLAGPLIHVPALDGVRGLAIGLVLLHHSQLVTNGAGGSVGVALFFVLSGFLITSVLLAERAAGVINLPRFYLRRGLRLLPAFLVVAAASGAILTLAGRPDDGLRSSLLAGTYVGNWILAAGIPLGPMSHSWSLAIEEQFYLVWPLVLLVFWPVLLRRGLWLLLTAAVASAVLRTLLWEAGATSERIAFGTDTQGGGLLVGAAVAFIWQRTPVSVPWQAGPSAIALLCFLAWAPAFGGSYLPLTQVLAVMACGALLVAAVSGSDRASKAALEWKPLRRLGLISYGVYLWHYPVMWYADVIHGRPTVWLSLAALAISIVLAVASYVIIELPILRWRDRHSGESRYLASPRRRAASASNPKAAGEERPLAGDVA